MNLFYREIGSGSQPIIVLHGLYGSSDNWLSFVRLLGNDYTFYLPDLPNHGQSAHTPDFSYSMLCAELMTWLEELRIPQPIIMGHSMGGKLAMEFAKQHPNKLKALIVADISPISYENRADKWLLNHEHIIEAMQSINLKDYQKRDDVEHQLNILIKDNVLCGFLMKNLTRNPDMSFRWRLNLPVLANNLHQIYASVITDNYRCPVPSLFIKAQNSNYINDADKQAISRLYPDSKFVEIANAGHWLHVDQPAALAHEIRLFLSENE